MKLYNFIQKSSKSSHISFYMQLIYATMVQMNNRKCIKIQLWNG